MKKCSSVAAILILASLWTMISSCQTKMLLVISQDCIAPCWRQIKPGKTTEKEVMELLAGFSDIKDGNIWQGGSNFREKYIAFNLSNGVNVTIYPIDNVVELILFDDPDGLGSIEDFVQAYGVPTYIVQTSDIGYGLPVGATSALHTWAYILNTKNGIVFSYDTYRYFGKNTDLSPETKVTNIKFYDTNSYETLLAEGFLVNKGVSGEFSISKLYPWAGYGGIDLLYPEK